MTRGKKTCKILKDIRQQIAEKNNIEYITSECNFKGECKGTCPKCEAELRYLENELRKRTQLGKAVTIAGISLGMAGAFAACNTAPKQDSAPVVEQPVDSTKSLLPIETDTIVENVSGLFVAPNIVNVTPPGEVIAPIDYIVGEPAVPYIEDTDPPKIYDYVPEMPAFPGGNDALMKFIRENLEYPRVDKEIGTEGTVVVQFIVLENGSLTDFKVVRSVSPGLNAEALRVAKRMPRWSPGRNNGEAVKVAFKLPVRFVIETSNE